MSLAVDVSSDPGSFDLPEWRGLLERDPDSHVFATPEWNRAWWEEFGSGKDLFVLTLRRGDEVVALIPLYRRSEKDRRILRFVGGIDLSDYLGPICPLEERADVAEALVRWLVETDVAWDEFDAHNMPVPFGFADLLVERADVSQLEFALEIEETSAVLRLPDDWASYEDDLVSKERHELRRKRRRLLREQPDARVRTATEETLESDLETFVELHRKAEGPKGHFLRPEIATFFERIARVFTARGWMRLDLLEIGGTAVAVTFSFETDGRFYLYNSAYDPEFRRLSPGLFLVSELVARSIEKGCKRFDFLRGPERYKYQLGAEAVPLHNVRIRRPWPTR